MAIWKRGGSKGRGNWYASVTIQNGGSPCREEICLWTTDKGAAAEVERKVNKLIACKISGDQPGAELAGWIETMPLRLRDRLVELDVLDRSRSALGKSISEHIAEYLADCEFRGQAEVHVSNKRTQLTKLVKQTGAVRLTDLSKDRLKPYLAQLKAAGKSHRTVNQHQTTAVAFLNWCVDQGRLQFNPLARLHRLNEKLDQRRPRRAATPEELAKFLAVVPHKRCVAYLMALYTGLRRSELNRLLVRDLDLANGRLRVRPEVSKSRREDVLPLHPQLKEVLADWVKPGAGPDEPLLPRMPTMKTFARDLTKAGIQQEDDRGRKLVFHSLRKTLATMLARNNVPIAIAKLITRHRYTQTLEDHYLDLTETDATRAINSIPAVQYEVAMDRSSVLAQVSPSAVDSTVRTPPSGASLGFIVPEGFVLELVGDDGEICYSSTASSDLLQAALARAKEHPERAQVVILRAVSAVG